MKTRLLWQFEPNDAPDDGALWLTHTTEMSGLINFQHSSGTRYFRIMVATRNFVDHAIGSSANGGAATVFPAMLVVPNGSPTEILSSIDDAVQRGGLAQFTCQSDD